MGQPGSVSRSFHRKGLISVEASVADEETLMELVLEAGAEDFELDGPSYSITTDQSDFMAVVDALTAANIAMERSELTYLPDTYMEVTEAKQAQSVLNFVEALEELDDVQDVYTNMDVGDDVMAQLNAEG